MSPIRRRSMRARYLIPLLLTSLLLAACGGGGDSNSATSTAPPPAPPTVTSLAQQATDGFNQFNLRRQQTGLVSLARNAFVDTAAQGHSNYQALNDTITHTEIAGKPGFTGVNIGPPDTDPADVTNRLSVAGYKFGAGDFAYGEVIARTSNTSGVNAANDLITAIFHRFVILEPMFKDAGAGAARSAGGATYFTTDFAVNGLNVGLGAGKFVVYPFANQTDIPTTFFSDSESPDPVPSRNAVGFPISVHADIISTVGVTTFAVQPRGGASLPVQLLTNATNPETPTSAAAIVPLDVLAAGTVYDVTFSGTVDGAAASRSWSFTTR